MENNYRVIGLMSGTSIDWLDIVGCRITYDGATWSYSIHESETSPYSAYWLGRLGDTYILNSSSLDKLDLDYGIYLGEAVLGFIKTTGFDPELICSHGHTILHQPEKGITFQAGSGREIASITRKKVVADFRTLDVKLGGQGAPLVPVGDANLFSDFDACLNLGGFANISYDKGKGRKAFDICPVNIALNYWANKLGHSFDKGGKIAATGEVNIALLDCLDSLNYYALTGPKSLGKEWLEKEFLPIIEPIGLNPNDVLRTLCEHIAIQLKDGLIRAGLDQSSVLLTGGGVYNQFLFNCFQKKTGAQLIIPDRTTVEYKEALVFGLLGVLRIRNEINCLSSVTGARKDSCTGNIFESE